MDRHKAIIFVDSQKRARGYSAEEALALGISNWKGWRCSAGKENVYINADGNIFSATCKVGGWMGNVYDGHVIMQKEWIECTKEKCVCGSDMQLRKARTLELSKMTYEKPPQETAELPVNPEWVAPYHWEQHNKYRINISWDLGRRCNYRCSYCHPSISNIYEAHRTWGSLKYATDLLLEYYCCEGFSNKKNAKWVFTGGEPTVNPAYMDLVKYIQTRGHLVHTQSNGSLGKKYFSELIEYSCIGLSYHFEGADPDRFLETCQAIVDKKRAHPVAALQWFGVRIMIPPGRAAEAETLRLRLLAIPHFQTVADLALSPLYDRMDQEKLMPYEPAEFETILQHT